MNCCKVFQAIQAARQFIVVKFQGSYRYHHHLSTREQAHLQVPAIDVIPLRPNTFSRIPHLVILMLPKTCSKCPSLLFLLRLVIALLSSTVVINSGLVSNVRPRNARRFCNPCRFCIFVLVISSSPVITYKINWHC